MLSEISDIPHYKDASCDEMKKPTFANLERDQAVHPDGAIYFYGSRVHPNPRWYKYYWRVFSLESEVEEEGFFRLAPRLCTYDAFKYAKMIKQAGGVCYLYNERLPRKGPDTPFDVNAVRWEGTEWAMPYDDDLDPVATDGGHK